MKKIAALNTSPEILFLDHISPLASLLDIPLIITHEKNATLTTQYYPEVNVRYWPDLEFHLKELSHAYDVLIECSFWAPHLKHLFQSCFQKDMRLLFCPHGQSDKGYLSPSLSPYAQQDGVLLYGNLMKTMLTEIGLWDSIPAHTFIGNFRRLYYQKHRTRMIATVEKEIFSSLNPANKTLLYAPTWNDADDSGTLFHFEEKLLKELPSDWNLILKVHPLLPEKQPALFYKLEEKRENFILVHEFPLIYPILEKIDAYLGDYSSIGYDALAFQKPLFFLTQPHLPPARLHRCGTILDPSQNLFKAIETRLKDPNPLQTQLYEQAFSSVPNLHEAIHAIL